MSRTANGLDDRRKPLLEDVAQSVSLRLSKIKVNAARDRRGGETELHDLLDSLSDVGLLHRFGEAEAVTSLAPH